jgi:hypothetical protein
MTVLAHELPCRSFHSKSQSWEWVYSERSRCLGWLPYVRDCLDRSQSQYHLWPPKGQLPHPYLTGSYILFLTQKIMCCFLHVNGAWNRCSVSAFSVAFTQLHCWFAMLRIYCFISLLLVHFNLLNIILIWWCCLYIWNWRALHVLLWWWTLPPLRLIWRLRALLSLRINGWAF